MNQGNLKQIVDQLETLNQEELKQLNKVIQQYLAQQEPANSNEGFYQSLLDEGLVKQIKEPVSEVISERLLIPVEGKPISETIIEERR